MRNLKVIYAIAAAGLLAGVLALEAPHRNAVLNNGNGFAPDGTTVVVHTDAKAATKSVAPDMPPLPLLPPAPHPSATPGMAPAPPMTAAPKLPPSP